MIRELMTAQISKIADGAVDALATGFRRIDNGGFEKFDHSVVNAPPEVGDNCAREVVTLGEPVSGEVIELSLPLPNRRDPIDLVLHCGTCGEIQIEIEGYLVRVHVPNRKPVTVPAE